MFVSFEFANYKTKKRPNEETGHIHNFKFYKEGIFIDYISRPSAVYVQDIDDDRNSLINQMEIKKMNFVEFINSRTLSKQQITKELKDLENKSGLHLLFNKEPKDIDLEIAKKQFEKIN
ncbi:hypothetical protein BCF89_1091, partial [Metamycoplasma auris]